LAPVFLGAEDHPPRYRRPKCLTGSAITLVRLARPNPRGRHARVADPSGVECQRDGSDQGQRMEAGNGALTPDRSPAPVTGCPPLASPCRHVGLKRSSCSRLGLHQPQLPPLNARWRLCPTRPLAQGQKAAKLHTIRFLPAGPSVVHGIVALMGETAICGLQSGRPEPGPGFAGMLRSLI